MKYKTGDESTLTREEKTVLARFRTGGHTPELGWYLELITKNKEEHTESQEHADGVSSQRHYNIT